MDRDVRSRITEVSARLRAAGVSARFEAPEKLHITLAFLGWVDAENVAPIGQTVQAIAEAHQPFDLRLDTISAFPSERRPRVIWLGTYKNHPDFRALTTTLRTRFGKLGFEFKSDAVQHITLCRLENSGAPLPSIPDVGPIAIAVREIALFQSLQAIQTTRYEILQRAALRKRMSP